MVYWKLLLILVCILVVSNVQADSAKYNMTIDADDWYWDNIGGNVTGSTTVYASYDNSISPSAYRYAFFKFDTSGLVDNVTINELRFNFYGHSYTVTPRSGLSLIYNLGITNSYVGEENFASCNTNVVFGTAGWKNINMTSSCLQYVNKTGSTYIRVVVPDPSAGLYRTMQLRAREYTGDFDAYLNVTWTNASAPPSGMCGTTYTGTGDWYINSDVNCTNINYSGQNINGNIIVNGSYTFDITNQTLNISLASKYISGLSGSKMIGVYV